MKRSYDRIGGSRLRLKREGAGLTFVRTGLPLLIAAVGVVFVATGDWGSKTDGTTAVGVVLVGTALMVWMLNWMFRMSVDSNLDREREEMAREYFDEHGHWPDEVESPGGDSIGDSAGAESPRGRGI
jgi:hypothetical protein